jgi:hypothetical protein
MYVFRRKQESLISSRSYCCNGESLSLGLVVIQAIAVCGGVELLLHAVLRSAVYNSAIVLGMRWQLENRRGGGPYRSRLALVRTAVRTLGSRIKTNEDLGATVC